jgi:RNA polymerase sigma factor (sigma-70 family)
MPDAARRGAGASRIAPSRDRTTSDRDQPTRLTPAGQHPATPSESYGSLRQMAERALRVLAPGRKPDADLVHDIVVRAMLGIGTWRAECSLPTWVYRIARSEIVDRARQRRTRIAVEGDAKPAAPPAAGPSAEDEALVQERLCRIARALARVARRRRLSLLGLSVWGDSAEEVGRRVGGTAGGVREAARKGRLQLRRLLRRECDSNGPGGRPISCPACAANDPCSAASDGWARCPLVVARDRMRLDRENRG